MHVEVSIDLSVLLSRIILKIGSFGLLRLIIIYMYINLFVIYIVIIGHASSIWVLHHVTIEQLAKWVSVLQLAKWVSVFHDWYEELQKDLDTLKQVITCGAT